MIPAHILFACLPTRLPVCRTCIKPTSSRRIGPVFSQHKISTHKHRSVVPIKIHPLHHDESFHPSLLPFLFDWWTKRWEIAEEVLMNCMAYTHYVTLMAKCMCAWLHHPLKLLLSKLLPCIDSSQPGWFHAETYMCILRLWFAYTAGAKIAIKRVQW